MKYEVRFKSKKVLVVDEDTANGIAKSLDVRSQWLTMKGTPEDRIMLIIQLSEIEYVAAIL